MAVNLRADLFLSYVCRYERTANDMLAKSTIAGQEGVITYLANAAALQQFEQTALAYVLMSEAGRSMGAPGLAAAAESLLEGKFEVGYCSAQVTECFLQCVLNWFCNAACWQC